MIVNKLFSALILIFILLNISQTDSLAKVPGQKNKTKVNSESYYSKNSTNLWSLKKPLYSWRGLGSDSCKSQFGFGLNSEHSNIGLLLLSPGLKKDENGEDANAFQKIGRIFYWYFKDTWHVFTSPTRIDKKNASYLGGIILISGGLFAYDQKISDAFWRNRDNKIYRPFLKIGQAIEPIGNMGKTNKYYFAGLAIGTIFKLEKLQEVTLQILESHFIGGGFKNVANILVGRARPFENKGSRNFEFNGGTSFPSGHASSSFQVATILSHHANYWPASVLFYGLAATIAVQRIDSKGHWPSDVFIGAVYGTAVGKAVVGLHQQRKVKVVPEYSRETNALGLRVFYTLN